MDSWVNGVAKTLKGPKGTVVKVPKDIVVDVRN